MVEKDLDVKDGIPLSYDEPNELTIASFEEAEILGKDKNEKGYKTVSELRKDLGL